MNSTRFEDRDTPVTLIINGKKMEVESGLTLKTYLLNQGINPNAVACELNMSIVRRQNLDQTLLKEGDELEIIQMIGGG